MAKPFWKRRREQLAARQARRRPLPFYEDPDNDYRASDCARQMRVFDALPAGVRSRMLDGDENVDLVAVREEVARRGASPRVRALLKERELMPCDVAPEELLALELEAR